MDHKWLWKGRALPECSSNLRNMRLLAPTLNPGQVVMMDNLGAHRPKRIRELIEGRGCELIYLPSYSPDLNPIEEALSKIKHLFR
jgi:transposase